MSNSTARLVDHFRFLAKLRRTAGFSAAAQWESFALRRAIGAREPERWRVRPKRSRHSLELRLRGSSDVLVFDQIFLDEEYSCLRDMPNVRCVVDLGANIGLSSAYFLACFPKSQVIALEPNPSNFELCRANLASFGERARVIHGAVWSKSGRVSVVVGRFRDGRDWSSQVEAAEGSGVEGEPVQAWSMEDFLAKMGLESVDLLKIDIERAELEIFREGAAEWLPRIRNICIELHGADCEGALFAALAEFDFDLSRPGELTICKNLRAKNRATKITPA